MRKALAPIFILAIIGTLGVFQREVLSDIYLKNNQTIFTIS